MRSATHWEQSQRGNCEDLGPHRDAALPLRSAVRLGRLGLTADDSPINLREAMPLDTTT